LAVVDVAEHDDRRPGPLHRLGQQNAQRNGLSGPADRRCRVRFGAVQIDADDVVTM